MQTSEVIEKFSEWLSIAQGLARIKEPTAMSLATASADGKPSVRIVLLKHHDEKGFVFYTNLESRKSIELSENPHASLCFFWDFGEHGGEYSQRQVRIDGRVKPVSSTEADAYFASRPYASRIGAWSSKQSRVLKDRSVLEKDIAGYEKQFPEDMDMPRPEHWSGWRVIPEVIEFWEQGPYRLHHREVYRRARDHWEKEALYP